LNKVVIPIVFLVLVAAGGAGYYLLQNLDGLVKDIIEVSGTEATGTRVNLEAVDLNLTEGGATLTGLTIANPEGFSPQNLFTMGSIEVDIDTESLSNDVYVIETIAVDGASVLAEQVGGGTNLQALLNNMDNNTSSSEAAETDGESADIRLAVESLRFTNGAVKLQSDIFGEHDLLLPAINMANLGTREQGLTPQELSEEIAGRLVGEITAVVSDELRDLGREAAKAKLKEKVGEGLGKLKGLFGGSGDDDTAEEGN
jgi:uncharacterized protein involved in outer membrane biogenesis